MSNITSVTQTHSDLLKLRDVSEAVKVRSNRKLSKKKKRKAPPSNEKQKLNSNHVEYEDLN